MTEWLYLASDSDSRATLADTLTAAVGRGVIWRATRKVNGDLIPNVQHLKPGDTLFLAFRQPVLRVYLRARIGKASRPAKDAEAVDVVGAPFSLELQRSGYPVKDGITEVIHLEDIEECCFDLSGRYVPNQQALWRLDRESIDGAAAKQGGELRLCSASFQAPDSTKRAASATKKTATKIAAPVGSVARVVPNALAGVRCFDAYVMVDWSASRSPASEDAADSIWFGAGEWGEDRFHLESPIHHPTRSAARAWLDARLAKWSGEKRRVLVGLDFAFGYPKGLAAALGHANGGWREVHRQFDDVRDDSSNEHSGAAIAAGLNARLQPSGPGPFWGCHARDVVPGILSQRRVGEFTFPYGPERLEEWRVTDRRARQLAVPQSVWKLNCGVSVGMQTVVGIKHLADLRRSLEETSRIWPFETGFAAPTMPGVWFAEIFPSIVVTDASVVGERPRDKRQVVSCLLEAAHRDATGAMQATLGRPADLSQAEVDSILQEEGWMLFL